MADIESASSSSAIQQPPTSTSHIQIPLISAEIHVEQQPMGNSVQPQQSSSSHSSTHGSTHGSSSSLLVQSSSLVQSQIQLSESGSTSDEPEAKKMKLDRGSSSGGGSSIQLEKLEHRLGGIFCCAVCLDLPKTAMYQCQMGHLMCAACFSHLLADGRLRDQVATCPNCRVEISKSTTCRNLAVEKAASELPSDCQYCNKEFPQKSIERHEQHECQERPTNCKYTRIGCQWKGPAHEVAEHESVCAHPHKTGFEVMSALEAHDAKVETDKRIFSTLIELLSYEKIIFNDLQMKPYRTDEYVHKLFYETSRLFSAFNHQWLVKARINNSQRDPHQSNDRTITYQLILKTKTTSTLSIHFFALKGPFSDMKVGTQIYKHEFSDSSAESEYYTLPLPDSSECNRLLSNKAINFRLLMFLLNK